MVVLGRGAVSYERGIPVKARKVIPRPVMRESAATPQQVMSGSVRLARCSTFQYSCIAEMCSGSEEGSYLRLIDFLSLNSRLETNKEEEDRGVQEGYEVLPQVMRGDDPARGRVGMRQNHRSARWN